jgi:very-short-patch-repair endonuclease
MIELKLKVLRVSNEEVNGNVDAVLQKITNYLNSSPNPFSTL